MSGDESRVDEPLLRHEATDSHSISNGVGSSLASRAGSDSESLSNSQEVDEDRIRSNRILRAQGHQAVMERSFSPLAALGLGFRYAYSGLEASAGPG